MKKLLLAITFILSACGNFIPADEVMQSWMGENIGEVVRVWGKPSGEKTIEGTKHVFWERRDIMPEAGSMNGYGGVDQFSAANINVAQTKPYMLNRESVCRKYFAIDENNIVTSWSVQGNGCSNFEDKTLKKAE